MKLLVYTGYGEVIIKQYKEEHESVRGLKLDYRPVSEGPWEIQDPEWQCFIKTMRRKSVSHWRG